MRFGPESKYLLSSILQSMTTLTGVVLLARFTTGKCGRRYRTSSEGNWTVLTSPPCFQSSTTFL